VPGTPLSSIDGGNGAFLYSLLAPDLGALFLLRPEQLEKLALPEWRNGSATDL
jgi:hypothetical protein